MPPREPLERAGGGRVEPARHLAATALGFQRDHGPIHPQRRRRGEPGQRLAPVPLGGRRILALQPGDVVAIGADRLQADRTAGRRVDGEQLAQHDRHRPAVHQRVMEGQHAAVTVAETEQGEPQQRRHGQVEAPLPVLAQEGRQLRRVLALHQPGPVAPVPRRPRRGVHHLQRRAPLGPEERRAQHRMALDDPLPGPLERRHVQLATDREGQLLDVDPRLGGAQRVEEHPLLQGGGWIDVLDLPPRHQAVEVGLGEAREREVRWRIAAGVRQQAMGDEAPQRRPEALGQELDGRAPVAVGAVGPAHLEAAAAHRGVDLQPMGPRLRGVARGAGRLAGEAEEAALLYGLVQLTQIVEGHLRARQELQPAGDGGLAEMAQQAVCRTAVGHGTQLLLDRLEGFAGSSDALEVEQDREQRGEPAHRARHVEAVRGAFPSVPLEVQQQAPAAGPRRERLHHGRQQEVVDPRPVGARGLAQQRPRLRAVERAHDVPDRARRVGAVLPILRQARGRRLQPCEPVPRVRRGRGLARSRREALGPAAVRGRPGRQHDRPALGQQAVRRLEVREEDAPRYTVDHQVVRGEQQPAGAVGTPGEQGGAQERAGAQIESGLESRRRGRERCRPAVARQGGEVDGGDGSRGLRRAIFLAPVGGSGGRRHEAHPQRVVVPQELSEGRREEGGLDRLRKLQEQGLVEMLRMRQLLREEPVLDGGQGHGADERPGRDPVSRCDLRDAGEPADRRVLEELARRQAQTPFGGAGDDLKAQNRVAAQCEEVVLDADALQPQDLGPDLGQHRLGPALRRRIPCALDGTPRRLQPELRQRTAVELAVGVERQRLQRDEMGRHHVLRQALGEEGAQLLASAPRVAEHREGRQACLSGGFAKRQDHGLAHRRVPRQHRLDLPRLDAEAADLDLVVDTAEVLDISVGQIAGQVAGTVEALARNTAERVGDEPLGGQLRPPEITARHPGATDVGLAGHADRHRVAVPVEEVEPQVGQGVADRAARGLGEVGAGERPVGRVDRGLGDAVHVDQPRRPLAVALPPGGQHRGCEGLATEDDQPQLQAAAQLRVDLLLRLDQLPEGGGRLVEDRHPGFHQQPIEGLRRAAHPVGNDDQPAAVAERSPDLPHREVESVGMEQRPDVVLAQVELVPGGGQEAGQVAVLDQHPLGPAGRARGVDDVGQAARRRSVREVLAALGRDVAPVGIQTQEPHRGTGAQAREQVAQRPLRQHHGPPAARGVGEDELQAFPWIRRLKGDVGAAGFEDAEQPHHHLEGALDAEGDPFLRSDPQPLQVTGELVRPGVELAIGQRSLRAGHGDGMRSSLCRGRKAPMDAVRRRETHRGTAPPGELPLLGRGEERQRREACARIGDGSGEQCLEMSEQPADGGGIEQVAVVLRIARQPVDRLAQGQSEVELRRAVVHGERSAGEAGRLQRLERRVLEHEHHLEQRRLVESPLRLQLRHHLLERRLLVGIGREARRAHPRRQLAEWGVAREVDAQHQGVDEEPDQVLELHPGAAGDRGADRQVLLVTVTGEQQGEGGEEHHERGGTLGVGEGGDPRGERRGERELLAGAAQTGGGRPGPVGRQLQLRQAGAQPLPPILEVIGEGGSGQPAPLPVRVVTVLERQVRQRRRLAGDEGPVEQPHLPHQDAQRPAIGHDVVEAQEEQVVRGAELQQRRPQQRPPRQIKGAARLGGEQAARLGGAARRGEGGEVDARRRCIARAVDALAGPAAGRGEGGAQHRVAAHHLGQRAPQHHRVEAAAQAESRRDVVGRAARL